MQDESHKLTPDEATLIGYLLVSDTPLHVVASENGMSLLEALEILDRPHCQERIKAARDAARHRFDAKAADAATSALQTLRDIADTPYLQDQPTSPDWPRHADPNRIHLIWQTERRRAATTIIRAANAHKLKHRHRRPPQDASANGGAGVSPAQAASDRRPPPPTRCLPQPALRPAQRATCAREERDATRRGEGRRTSQDPESTKAPHQPPPKTTNVQDELHAQHSERHLPAQPRPRPP